MPDLPITPPHYALGFPPIIGEDPVILILGSLPGAASLAHQQYYAHPQNAFWRILEALFNIPAKASYAEKCAQVINARLAIWDVCHSACRQGSLDSAITAHTVMANDINGLLEAYPTIKTIAFNGSASANLFKRHIKLAHDVMTLALPSTSPANASIPYLKKLERWSVLLERKQLATG